MTKRPRVRPTTAFPPEEKKENEKSLLRAMYECVCSYTVLLRRDKEGKKSDQTGIVLFAF